MADNFEVEIATIKRDIEYLKDFETATSKRAFELADRIVILEAKHGMDSNLKDVSKSIIGYVALMISIFNFFIVCILFFERV